MWKFCHMHNVPSSNLWFLRLPTRLVRSLTRYSPATNGCGCSQWFHNMFPWNSESMSPCITALEVSAFCDLIIAKSSRIGRGGTMGLWWILALGELVLSSTLLTPLWRVQSSPRFGLEKKSDRVRGKSCRCSARKEAGSWEVLEGFRHWLHHREATDSKTTQWLTEKGQGQWWILARWVAKCSDLECHFYSLQDVLASSSKYSLVPVPLLVSN